MEEVTERERKGGGREREERAEIKLRPYWTGNQYRSASTKEINFIPKKQLNREDISSNVIK